MTFNEFLSTAGGSFLKVFLTAVLTQITIILADAESVLWSLESLRSLGIIGALATLPVIINWLNPQDPRYGKESKKETEIVEKQPDT